jgi:hypothetical protein
MKFKSALFAFVVLTISIVSAVTSAQRKPETDKPITGDFKITVKTTIAGQSRQSTTMIKGARERSESSIEGGAYSMNTVNITQCDMRRTIQINDRARKFLITPMDSDNSSGNSETSTVGAPPASGLRRGGTVTMIVNTVDTGERKEILGFTARHLKRTTMMESSPDACNPGRMKIETDGWYINLEYGLNCPANQPPGMGGRGMAGGCRDRYVHRTTGPAVLGYPLQEITTMYGADGNPTMTMTKEVVEISRQTLDAALFDVPAGYTEARSQEEMYATPSMDEMMASARQRQNSVTNEATSSSSNSAERVRVGVVDFNNKAKTSVETDGLRQQLIAALTAKGIDAVPLNAISASEAATEAQAKKCAYILFTDIATLKTPSAGKKIGGLFGRATGVGSADAGKNEAKFDFRLVATGSSSPTAQSSASAKEDTQEAAVNAAIQSEARAVVDAIPRP